MFGTPKQEKSDEQKSLEERGKEKNLKNLKNYHPQETIFYKDDYQARVSNYMDDDMRGSLPYIVACSDLIKEGYTLVSLSTNGIYIFQKLPK